jgi:3-phenylpropionate/cinnamic acid dioxygenase small subunit
MPNISHEQAIANLIARYAFLVDDGDFRGLAQLFADGEFILNGGTPAIGSEAVEALAHAMLRTYDDGTPRTRHVTTNLIIELDDAGEAASSRSYYTVFQATAGFPLQPIACGRYSDRFALKGRRWVFTHREVETNLVGDVSHHRR